MSNRFAPKKKKKLCCNDFWLFSGPPLTAMALASPCRSARRKSGEKRPRVTFNETARCVLFRRGPGFDTLPADGGISLALDDFVTYHYEPLSLTVDETHGAGTPRRHPARRREEQLAKMPPSEREVHQCWRLVLFFLFFCGGSAFAVVLIGVELFVTRESCESP
jgi:hypothetical protein